MLVNMTDERRDVEEAAAWSGYLATVRAVSEEAYEQLEALAWRRLCRELARLARPLPDDVGGDET